VVEWQAIAALLRRGSWTCEGVFYLTNPTCEQWNPHHQRLNRTYRTSDYRHVDKANTWHCPRDRKESNSVAVLGKHESKKQNVENWLLLLSYYNSNAIVEKPINFITETFERFYSRQIWTVYSILSSPHTNIFTTNFKKVTKLRAFDGIRSYVNPIKLSLQPELATEWLNTGSTSEVAQ